MSDTRHIILNGQVVAKKDAAVSPVNRGMMYGDGCFETLRYYAGKFLRWNEHYDRMRSGLNYLEIECPYDSNELKGQVLELLRVNGQAEKEVMIRIQCWREGGRGYKTDSSEMGWLIQTSAIKSDESPLNLTLAQTRCIPSEALARHFKLSNSLNYIKAAQEASSNQCDDALMLTVGDNISETTSANIFWVKDEEIFTPSAECDLLPGVTRSLLIQMVNFLGMQISEGKFSLKEIKKADAVFCTNSLIEIREVRTLDKISFHLEHPVVKKIKAGFEQLKEKELKE